MNVRRHKVVKCEIKTNFIDSWKNKKLVDVLPHREIHGRLKLYFVICISETKEAVFL